MFRILLSLILLCLAALTASAQVTPLTQAEYFVGADPGPGNGTPLSLPASVPGLARDLGEVTIPVGSLPVGTHAIGVRVRDEQGRWSNPLLRRFTVRDYTLAGGVNPNDPNVGNSFTKPFPPLAQAEYFVGTDPGAGNGTSFTLPASTPGLARDLAEVTIPVGALPVGTHTVGVRVKDEQNRWSNALRRRFTVRSYTVAGGVDPNSPNVGNSFAKPFPQLTEAEYFMGADPGPGNGTPLALPASTPGLARDLAEVEIPAEALPPGTHEVGVRVRDEQNRWSRAVLRRFTVYRTDVQAAQREGTKLVDLSFDLFEAPQPFTVVVLISADGGLTWDVPNGSLTGDVGAGVKAGPNRQAIWHAGEDWPNGFAEDMRFRVVAYQTAAMPPEGHAAVAPGSFTMGSPAGETGRGGDETAREVTLARPFYLKQTEVTWAEWNAVRDQGAAYSYGDIAAGRNGRNGDGSGTHPVTEVSWMDAVKWCNLKSEIEGKMPVYYTNASLNASTVVRAGLPTVYASWNANGYRLPTEAEWEFACRAGAETAFFNGPITDATSDPNLDEAGWYAANSGANTQPVGDKAANALGLRDVHGNVREWCWDAYAAYAAGPQWDPTGPATGAARVARGGSWSLSAAASRAAARTSGGPNSRAQDLGFRTALNADGLRDLRTPGGTAVDARDPAPGNLLAGRRATVDGEVLAAVAQPDGKILIAGDFFSVNEVTRPYLARLLPDGTVDETFDANVDYIVRAVAVQEDGKILIGGDFSSAGYGPANFLARLLPDGMLDGEFWADTDWTVHCLAVQADGKILIGGEFTSVAGEPRQGLARLWPDGAPEEEFQPHADGPVRALAVQVDGRILVGGEFSTVAGTPRANLARLTADGTVESFNPGANGAVTCLAVQANGQILVGGEFFTLGGAARNGLGRLSAAGAVDSAYNPNPNGSVLSLLVQADARLWVSGAFSQIAGQPRASLARLNTNGTADTTLTLPAFDGEVRAVTGLADGRIVAAGAFTSVGGVARHGLAWLDNNAATGTLSAPNSSLVRWLRGGGAAEAQQVTFDLSADGGGTWLPLGAAVRISGGWQLAGVNLPAAGQVRARARIGGGVGNTSSGLVESTASFSGLIALPEIAVEDAGGQDLATGATVAFDAPSTSTFTIKNLGYGALTGLGVTLTGTNPGDFVVLQPPVAPVAGPSGSTSMVVQFAPQAPGTRTATLRIANNDANENPFTLNLSGAGFTAGGVDAAFTPAVSGSEVLGLAAQPDGRLVVGGEFSSISGQSRTQIARLLEDGGVEGLATFNPGAGANLNVFAVAVQSDRQLALGGYFSTLNGQPRNGVGRLNPDGTVEGLATFNPGDGASGPPYRTVNALAVQPDGKLIAVGYFTSFNGQPRGRIARLLPDGTLESTETFNPGTGANDIVTSVVVQPDGKILLAGSFTQVNGQPRNRIARLLPDGTLESTATFNPGTGADGPVNVVAVQPDGKILLGGAFNNVSGQPRGCLARLNADGTLESAATFNPGAGADGDIHSLILQADGKILLGGAFTQVNSQPRNRIARLLPNGAVESTATFNVGGGFNGTIAGLILQADGKIVAGGYFSEANGQPRALLARLHNDGAVQQITTPDSSTVQWTRGGGAPEAAQVTFELSTNGGSTWTALGSGSRITGGWRLTGINLPANGKIRAQGRTVGGYLNGSSGLVDQVADFTVTPRPDLQLADAGGQALPHGGNFSFGGVPVGAEASRVFTIRNHGYAPLGGLSVSFTGADAAMFSVTSQPSAPVAGPNGTTPFTVRFQHTQPGARTAVMRVASNDPDTNPYEITLTGRDVSTNANLASLGLSAGSLSPSFAPATTSYSITVPYSTAELRLTPVAADPVATITVNGEAVASGSPSEAIRLSVGSTPVTTRVTAEDGVTTKTYALTVTRTAPLPGTLEPSFDPALAGGGASSLAVQPDGKILAAHQLSSAGGVPQGFFTRLNVDGTRDTPPSFNPGTGADALIQALAVQNDGKILLAGDLTSVNGQGRSRLARLLPDGSVESLAGFNIGSGANDRINTIALQPDGRILIAGRFTSVNGQGRNLLARLLPNGQVEGLGSFAIGSGASPANFFGEIWSIAVQPDGKILLAGVFTGFNGVTRHRLARLHANGTLDTDFDPGADDQCYALVVQPDGKILVGGEFTTIAGASRNKIARLHPDGSLDTSFDPGSGLDGYVNSLALQADGSVLISGNFTSVDSEFHPYLARLRPDGSVEPVSSFDIGNGPDAPGTVLLEADGSILYGGTFSAFDGVPRGRLARLANGPAVQFLSVPDASRVRWQRGGTTPEVEQVVFDLSLDGGVTWQLLGAAWRITGGWELTGLNLPGEGMVRARGRSQGGALSVNGSLIEQTTAFSNTPFVTTAEANPVTPFGATLNAQVIPNGTATVRFEYGATPAYGSTSSTVSLSGLSQQTAAVALTGLSPNTTYYFRALATNSIGTTYGEGLSFSTPPDPPLAVTANPSSVTPTSAVLTGAVNPGGRPTTVYFEYGLTPLYGNITPQQNAGAGTSVLDMTAPVSGLVADATYHYRIVASNAAGTTFGADVSFRASSGQPPGAAPSVSTGGVTDLTTSGVTLLGTVNPNGGFTNAYFEYGPTAAYGSVTQALGAGNGTVPVNLSAAVTGLAPGTLYYYRLVAQNSLGTTVGTGATFTTNFPPPEVVTGGAVALTTTSARISGTVLARNTATQVFFDYGTDGVTFPYSVNAVPGTVAGNTPTAVSADLSNLQQGLTYHYRLRATSSGGASLGAVATFVPAILSGLDQLFPGAPPPATGVVRVVLEPEGVATGWRFSGETQWRASGETATALASGEREIEFRPLAGWIQPLPELVSVLSGEELLVEGQYFETPDAPAGRLSVTLKPDALGGAQWRLLGEGAGQWRNSGATLEGLAPGLHVVESKPVAGRTAPPPTSVVVEDDATALLTLTYVLESTPPGQGPVALPFATVSTDTTQPYAWVGQLRSQSGFGTGFVVKPRVVATAAHVVWDEGTLSAAVGMQWLFQRDRGTHEPAPQTPRGFYVFDGYAAQREAENTPGTSSPQSQQLDVAALYFLEDAGRGGYSGYLASDLNENEFLLSSAKKMIVGYPVDAIAEAAQGRMHATPAANVAFTRAYLRTYATSQIYSRGGHSGGPLFVQHESGGYYPAAIYLGGTGQTIVRALDSDALELFRRAEVSASGGENNTGGGITHSSVSNLGNSQAPGRLRVLLAPAGAVSAGGWRLKGENGYRDHNELKSNLAKGNYTLELKPVAGYQAPSSPTISIQPGQERTVTFTYESAVAVPVVTSPGEASGTRGQPFSYQITATNSPASYGVTGTLPAGVSLNTTTGLLSGTPTAAGSFTVTLRATNAGGTGTKALTLTVRTPMETWRMQHFGTSAPTGIAADTADPDFDGFTNLVEYALGADPRAAVPPAFEGGTDAGGRLRLAFTHDTRATDLVLLVEIDDDLQNTWTPLARSENGGAFSAVLSGVTVTTTGAGPVKQVTVTDTVTMQDPTRARRFIKLRALRP